jgi:hypothetical protein
MPECNYCDRDFDSEDRYHQHLAEEHQGELSRLDRRRIEGIEPDDDEGIPTGPAILVGVIGFALALMIYVVLFLGSGGGGSGVVNGIDVAQTPTNVGSTDFHGLTNVTIDGQQLDFSQERFQLQDRAFHFENARGDVWHGHADGLTLEYAMATLGIEVSETSVTYQGTTYRDSDPDTTVQVLVNGEPVDPATYELEGVADPTQAGNGDSVEIVVTRTG